MAFASIEQKLSQVCDPQFFFCVHNADKAKQPYIKNTKVNTAAGQTEAFINISIMEYIEIPLNEQASTS